MSRHRLRLACGGLDIICASYYGVVNGGTRFPLATKKLDLLCGNACVDFILKDEGGNRNDKDLIWVFELVNYLEDEVGISTRVFYYKSNLMNDYNKKVNCDYIEMKKLDDCICKDLVFEVWEYAIDEMHSISFKKCKDIDICFAEVEYADMEDYHKMQGKIKGYDFVKEDVTENEKFYVKNIWRQFCGE